MRIKQTDFTGGMTGRRGQYVRDIKNSFIEGVNLLPRRDGSLETRPRDKKLPFNFLPTDKYLNFRYHGQVYHVIYDTFFKQKLKEVDVPSTQNTGLTESNLTGGFYHKYMTANPPAILDDYNGYLATQVQNPSSTNQHSIDVYRASLLRALVRGAARSISDSDSVYQFLVGAVNSLFGDAANVPLGCTFYDDITKAGLGLRSPSQEEIDSRSGNFAERVNRHRGYFGFGLDRLSSPTSSRQTNPSPPPPDITRVSFVTGGWYYNFIRNIDASATPGNITSGYYNQASISSGEVVNGFNGDGDGFKVFKNDSEGTDNWYCRFLVFNESLQLVSYEVERPYFVEHDSGETTGAVSSALNIPDGHETPPNLPSGTLTTEQISEFSSSFSSYLKEVMNLNLEASRNNQGVTDLVYETEVFDEYVLFTNREGKLPPLVFSPPDTKNPEFDEHPYGFVRDLRCLYGLSGYLQESHIKGNEVGGTVLKNFLGDNVSVDSRNLKFIDSLVGTFITSRSSLSGFPVTGVLSPEQMAVEERVIDAVRTSFRDNTAPSVTRNRIAETDVNLFSSPAVSFDDVIKTDLPEDNPLRTFNSRRTLEEAINEDDSRELVTLVSKQVTVSEDDASAVTDVSSFTTYLSNSRFSHLGALVQVRTPDNERPDTYQMVDFRVRGEGRSFKDFIVQQSILHEFYRLRDIRTAVLDADVVDVTTGVSPGTFFVNRGQSEKDFSLIPHGLGVSKVAGEVEFLREPTISDRDTKKDFDISGGQSSNDFLVDSTFFKFDIGGLEESRRLPAQVVNNVRFPPSLNTIGQPHPVDFSSLIDKKLGVVNYAVGSNEGMYFNRSSIALSRLAIAETFIRRDTVIYSQPQGRLLFDNLIVVSPPGTFIGFLGFLQRYTPQGGAEVRWLSSLSGNFTVGFVNGLVTYSLSTGLARGVAVVFSDETSSSADAPIKSHDVLYQIGGSLRHVYLIERSLELSRREFTSVTRSIFTDYLKDDPIRKLLSLPDEGYLILVTEGGLCFFGLVFENGAVGWSRLLFNPAADSERVIDVFAEEGITYFVFSDITDGRTSTDVRSVEFDRFEPLQDGEQEITSSLELISPYRYSMEVEETDPTQNTDAFSVRGGKLIGSFSNTVQQEVEVGGKKSYVPFRFDDSIIDLGAERSRDIPHLSGMKFVFRGRTTIASLFYKVE